MELVYGGSRDLKLPVKHQSIITHAVKNHRNVDCEFHHNLYFYDGRANIIIPNERIVYVDL